MHLSLHNIIRNRSTNSDLAKLGLEKLELLHGYAMVVHSHAWMQEYSTIVYLYHLTDY